MCYNNSFSTNGSLCGHHKNHQAQPSYLIDQTVLSEMSSSYKTHVQQHHKKTSATDGPSYNAGRPFGSSSISHKRNVQRRTFPKLGAMSWRCCKCGQGSNSIVYNATCNNCGHKRDSGCAQY